MDVKSNVDRFDVGFGRETSLRGVEVAKRRGLRLFFLGGMTKTSGICTELKEDGGTTSPGESNEREVSIAESRRRKNKVLVQEMFNR